ncbi:MAG: SDR family NAD(P)-dependent oxidoreductase [Candidatus Acidiferrales bacterium]
MEIARMKQGAAVLSAEAMLAAAAYGIATFATASRPGTATSIDVVRETVAFALFFRFAALLWTKLYRRSLRYSTSADLICIAKAVCVSELALAIFLLFWLPMLHIPISLFVVDAAFVLILWGGLHFGARIWRAYRWALNAKGRRTLIIGAGDAGIMLLKEIALDANSTFRPVAILDDDATKWGSTIGGVPVHGGIARLASVAEAVKAEEVLVCIPSATRVQMRTVIDACRRAELPVRTLPPIAELVRHGCSADRLSATVSRRDLRPPRIEDLLDRELIHVDAQETRKLVEDQVVLVTGAGGSIGSELARQVAAAGPRKLLLLDKSENGLFYANLEASEKLGAANVMPVLADVLDRERVRRLFRGERPSLVFHAAAHKHVAMMDLYPREAIRNNAIGTRNVAEAALEFGASRFVNISTDKAVNPRNWMGLSKKITELCIQELSGRGSTRFSSVRFGNVAGSSGSVLRLFWERIERREAIRVTDPRATRFFMSVPEAVHLILRAGAIGNGGETFILEMGEPVNICELAKTMMLCSGLRPGRDLKIVFTGLQPGEKLDEELWDDREHPVVSCTEHILVIREKDPGANGIGKKIGRMEELLARAAETEVLDYLYSLFPDFRWNRGSLEEAAPRVPDHALARSAGAA